MAEGDRYRPRPLPLGDLIEALVKEHLAMKEGLRRARDAAGRKSFDEAGAELRKVDPIFRQHIADEESQILGLLIRRLGVKGAADEIRVFQQHRPIYQLMKKVSELAALSSAELEGRQGELEELFELHTKAEEASVFPRAKGLSRA
ncbi:MAG: hypothetical protein JRM80_10800 [Nitrososphaerota archaeon]|nr:hypothetical protein [Nitrososphaerota archaeon]